MKQPLISVIIPTYNYGQYIRNAIDSVLVQSYKNFEILVIDDGSTDNTAEILVNYGTKISYNLVQHGGVSAARNYGASIAHGTFSIFLDADDKLHPYYIHKTLKLLQNQQSDVGYAYTQMQYFGDSEYITQYPGYNLAYLKISNFINTCTLIKTELLHKYNFDSRIEIWEDWDFYLTLAEHGIIGVLLNEPLLYYRKHITGAGSALDNFTVYKRLYSAHMLRMKHWKLYGNLDTAQHWGWYAYNRLKQATQGKKYEIKAPDDRTGLRNNQRRP